MNSLLKATTKLEKHKKVVNSKKRLSKLSKLIKKVTKRNFIWMKNVKNSSLLNSHN